LNGADGTNAVTLSVDLRLEEGLTQTANPAASPSR